MDRRKTFSPQKVPTGLYDYLQYTPSSQTAEDHLCGCICRAGFRKDAVTEAAEENLLFDVTSDSDAEALRKGSTQVALETNPAFFQYIFIENNEEHVGSLSNLRRQFPAIASRITIVKEDANSYLLTWCQQNDWIKTRAVVFLDPYGMQVEWSTINAMANTKAIDLWILFPLGIGVNRLLMKQRPPEDRGQIGSREYLELMLGKLLFIMSRRSRICLMRNVM